MIKILNLNTHGDLIKKKVLRDVQKYISDGKVNIVAAPRIWKNYFGIRACKKSWKTSNDFSTNCYNKKSVDTKVYFIFYKFYRCSEWISTNIYNLKFFNVVTYQALHYAFKKQKIRSQKVKIQMKLKKKEEGIEDLEKIKSYNLIEEIKKIIFLQLFWMRHII